MTQSMRSVLVAAMCGLLAAAFCCFPSAVSPVPTAFCEPAMGDNQADPLTLRRVLIPPERVPAELERARGVLEQRTRAEFEDLVRKAQQAAEALKNPPRLVEGRYFASLVDTSLRGRGEWNVINKTGPG